jgi:hypothetical protein
VLRQKPTSVNVVARSQSRVSRLKEARYGGPKTIKERFKASESPQASRGKKAKKGTETGENLSRAFGWLELSS